MFVFRANFDQSELNISRNLLCALPPMFSIYFLYLLKSSNTDPSLLKTTPKIKIGESEMQTPLIVEIEVQFAFTRRVLSLSLSLFLSLSLSLSLIYAHTHAHTHTHTN